MKHDSHVRTAFKHFFPTQLFLALTLFTFLLGLIVGNAWGYFACQSFMLLINK